MPKFSDYLSELTQQAEDKIKTKVDKSWAWYMERSKRLRKEATNTPPPQRTDRIIAENKGMMLGTDQFPVLSMNDKNTMIGRMVLYNYDPKHKKTLPYYDIYPLVFPIKLDSKGFLGINLHYLPLSLRAQLMDALYTLINTKTIKETTRIKLSYNILNGAAKFSAFRPCVKRYLYPHVRSQFLMVSPLEWDAVLMLPLQRFIKADQTTVWADSRRMISSSKSKQQKRNTQGRFV